MRLCAPVASEADLSIVNNMRLEDSLEVSTFLHARLKFERSGDRILPSPWGTDVLDICRGLAAGKRGGLEARCKRELEAEKSGERNALYIPWTEAELEELPPQLNALYGIP